MELADLPALNATLNGLSTLFLVAGYAMIKSGRKRAHAVCMVSALAVSAAFLTSYLIYHFNVQGVTKFQHEGAPKIIYFFILLTHIPLAMVNLPMIIATVIPAARQRFDRHRLIAKWTLPVWLYVSVTGVLVYLMLYVWYPGST